MLKSQKKSRKPVKLLDKSRAKFIVDDEKYFCFDEDNMPGSGCYYTNDKAKCLEDVRFIGKYNLDSYIQSRYVKVIF